MRCSTPKQIKSERQGFAGGALFRAHSTHANQPPSRLCICGAQSGDGLGDLPFSAWRLPLSTALHLPRLRSGDARLGSPSIYTHLACVYSVAAGEWAARPQAYPQNGTRHACKGGGGCERLRALPVWVAAKAAALGAVVSLWPSPISDATHILSTGDGPEILTLFARLFSSSFPRYFTFPPPPPPPPPPLLPPRPLSLSSRGL